MATEIESIQQEIDAVTASGFRGQLIARGQARALIWSNGEVPIGAPDFSAHLSYDLQSYGYSLLGLGLRLLELGGDQNYARRAFESAASALEASIAKGSREDHDRNFHFVVAASCYHLAHLSARAYSLLTIVREDENFSFLEKALVKLMLRDLSGLEDFVLDYRMSGEGSDERIAATYSERWAAGQENIDESENGNSLLLDGVDLAITDNFLGAIAMFLLALERGEKVILEESLARLREGLAICGELNFLPQWWSHKIAIHLLSDLWASSFHEKLPRVAIGGSLIEWPRLRELFIAVLLRRSKAEIDLWPSQFNAAQRAIDQSDNLVVSLPTSAGKTRISELCILRCLADGKRVIFVTPLRALSAQTETTLQRMFAPLGKTISALYGSIGASGIDEDTIRQRDIVVATPEKLDFALRNDPTLLDDVGLLIFDEGHMIGLSEREVRYEVQIQRLLRRADAGGRRIVCLSAILPDGEQLDDFAGWLRSDQPGGIVKSEWRPTRLRFGEVIWNGQTARLNLRVGEERPFVPVFLRGLVPPIGQRTTIFPKDLGELCLASAWRLVGDGHSVLVFCPVRAHVEPFASRIVDLNNRGALRSLLDVNEALLGTAIALGQEWLGQNHPILQCLKLGVAIHHGALPAAFRKEIERLLREGILKVTISSPTLAQGLNLSATTVIVHSLHRNRERIETSEFKNVVGRAGRAYVDIEGLVLYPIFDKHAYRVSQWEELIADLSSREMESGLYRLVLTLLQRIHQRVGGGAAEFIEYVMNNTQAWVFPEIQNEPDDAQDRARIDWEKYIASLDTAILSMIGENEIDDNVVADTLDNVLRSSLWERRLNRKPADTIAVVKAGLLARSKYILANSSALQRRGYFLAGIGLSSGKALDEISGNTNLLLVQANGAILNGDSAAAINAFTELARNVFNIPPFSPDQLPANWEDILRLWLLGLPLAEISVGNEAKTLQFIEGGLVYRLPWAMESIRVRGIANGEIVGEAGLPLNNYVLSVAVSCIVAGTLNYSASILIHAGFSSRLAAIKAVNDSRAIFSNSNELRAWLKSDLVNQLSTDRNWPTRETHELWTTFRQSFTPTVEKIWSEQKYWIPITWFADSEKPINTPVRCHHSDGELIILSADGLQLGRSDSKINPNRQGLLRASVMEPGKILLLYLGPTDLSDV